MKGFLTIIDFETTGFGDCYGTEIGLISVNEHLEVVEEFETILNPPIAANPKALEVAGLNYAQLRAAPTFREIWSHIHPFISGRVLVAHNAVFDMGVLSRELLNVNNSTKVPPSFCTLTASRSTWLNAPNYQLGTLANYLDLNSYAAHAAIGDCHTTRELLVELVNEDDAHVEKLVSLSSKTLDFRKPSKSRYKPHPRIK